MKLKVYMVATTKEGRDTVVNIPDDATIAGIYTDQAGIIRIVYVVPVEEKKVEEEADKSEEKGSKGD